MNFSSQTLLLKYQRFNDNKNEERRIKVYIKRQQINKSENQEKEDLANYNSDRYEYVLLSPNPKVINYLSNLGK